MKRFGGAFVKSVKWSFGNISMFAVCRLVQSLGMEECCGRCMELTGSFSSADHERVPQRHWRIQFLYALLNI